MRASSFLKIGYGVSFHKTWYELSGWTPRPEPSSVPLCAILYGSIGYLYMGSMTRRVAEKQMWAISFMSGVCLWLLPSLETMVFEESEQSGDDSLVSEKKSTIYIKFVNDGLFTWL